MTSGLRAQDLALVLASDHAKGDAEAHPLDRIRMQKAVFLLIQRGSESWRHLYTYRPYDWGPYSGQLQADLDMLMFDGSLRVAPVAGRRYGCFETTATGEDRAEDLWEALDVPAQQFIRAVRGYVTSRSFTQLLREVYAEYPEYATNSRFQG